MAAGRKSGKKSRSPAAKGSGAPAPQMMSLSSAQAMMKGQRGQGGVRMPKGAAQMMRGSRSSS